MSLTPFVLTLSLLVLAVIIVFALGTLAKSRLKKQYPPAGQMIDLDGYRLHLLVKGDGGPTVVLDAGAGEFSLMWHTVQREISKQVSVVAYDRAGLGWSDLSPHPRTNFLMVEELRSLLKKAKIPGPYVLVGASLGGLNMKVYAFRYPQEVAGLVLVDAAHEEQYQPQQLQEALRKMKGMMAVMSAVQKTIAFSGLSALFPRLTPMGLPGSIPADIRQAYRAVRAFDRRNIVSSLTEIKLVEDSHAMIRAERIDSLGDIPLIVVQHGKRQAQMMPGLDEIMEETNRRLQAVTANLSKNGTLIVAENSGHDVVGDEPDLVIDAICSILRIVRERYAVLMH
jgi:pimeloyl-ACP methyl ester carboxylesterase